MTAPEEVVERVLEAATGFGCTVAVETEQSTNLRWALSRLTTNGDTRSTEVSVTSFAEVAGGISTATRCGPASEALALLHQAEEVARVTPAASDAMPLLTADQVSRRAHPRPGPSRSGQLNSTATPESREWLTPDPAPGLQSVVASLGSVFADRELEYFGFAEETTTVTTVGTSSGQLWSIRDAVARFEISAKADEGRRSAWAGAAGSELGNLDVTAAVTAVRTGLAHQTRRIEVPAHRMPVILSPSAVADLMIALWWQMSARDAAEGRSAFSGTGPVGTALGSTLSDRDLTLTSDPADPELPAPDRLWTPWSSSHASVFDTGCTVPATRWLEEGVLTCLISTRDTASRTGLEFRPSADNLRLTDAGGYGDLSDLVARTDHALLITSLWYIRDVDPQSMLVTGLTRDGTYLVRDGQITAATGNFRFNDSPLGLLGRIRDAGVTAPCLPREWGDYFTRAAMPALLVDDFGLSTASEAV